MRVLHVMESTIGGTRRHLVDVASGQLERGLDVHVAAAALRQPDFAEDLDELERRGAQVLRLPMRRAISPGADARHLTELLRYVRSTSPDVVHTHSSKAGVLGRLASMYAETGVRVHTPHTFAFLFRDMFGPLKRGMFRRIESSLAERTARFVAVSEGEARTFEASGIVSADRIRVVHNGLGPSAFRGAEGLERAALGVPEGAPLAAVVGLLNVAKGQDLALRALAAPACGNLHLLVAGWGETEGLLRDLARTCGIEDRVHFLGWREDVAEVLATCDFLVLPSRWEGMPYVLLEALACGLPAVASRVDGAVDILEGGAGGFLVEADSVAALASGLESMLALPGDERRAVGRRGRDRVLEHFTLERMVDGLIEVYEELL